MDQNAEHAGEYVLVSHVLGVTGPEGRKPLPGSEVKRLFHAMTQRRGVVANNGIKAISVRLLERASHPPLQSCFFHCTLFLITSVLSFLLRYEGGGVEVHRIIFYRDRRGNSPVKDYGL